MSQRTDAFGAAARTHARAIAPATVANVACGFDVLGFAVEGPTDVVTARPRTRAGVVIESIDGSVEGFEKLPMEAERNTAGVAAHALLETAFPAGQAPGVALSIEKGIPAGSGLGSSAASAAAAALAVDALFDLGSDRDLLFGAALAGEAIVSGAYHGDNVAPALFGGFQLVRLDRRPRMVSLPVPNGLHCALLRPHLVALTGAGREKIGTSVSLAVARSHWGNTAALVAGLFGSDPELIASALEDRLAEPVRHCAVPRYFQLVRAATSAGALGAGLAGSGPTVFALCTDEATARAAGDAMEQAFRPAGVASTLLISPVGAAGGQERSDRASQARDPNDERNRDRTDPPSSGPTYDQTGGPV